MPHYFAMPKLGMDMTEGRIAAWLADEGSWIKAGQPLLEIETDKATNELEAPVNGRLARIIHAAGDQVACGTIIAVFLDENEAMPAVIPQSLTEYETDTSESVNENGSEMGKRNLAPAPGQRISIAPSARKLADELGVDLTEVEFTGDHINRADVQRAFDRKKTQPVSPDLEKIVKPLLGIRKVTAERMLASANATARVALNISVDAGALMDRRKASDPKVSYNVLIAKAVSVALRKYPYMNARLSGDEIWEFITVNIGIAVQTEQGLYVPVLRDVDRKQIGNLQSEYLSLVERVKSGKSTSSDLTGGTFTISNLGEEHIESFVPVINLPECAILGVGAILPRPVVENANVVIRNMMKLTLVFDHRLVDGKPAGKFLYEIKEILEKNDY